MICKTAGSTHLLNFATARISWLSHQSLAEGSEGKRHNIHSSNLPLQHANPKPRNADVSHSENAIMYNIVRVNSIWHINFICDVLFPAPRIQAAKIYSVMEL